ncbi:hypothetical protein ABKN59_005264 [Abortiporus biennis]
MGADGTRSQDLTFRKLDKRAVNKISSLKSCNERFEVNDHHIALTVAQGLLSTQQGIFFFCLLTDAPIQAARTRRCTELPPTVSITVRLSTNTELRETGLQNSTSDVIPTNPYASTSGWLIMLMIWFTSTDHIDNDDVDFAES